MPLTELKQHQKSSEENIELKAIRDGFGEGLVVAGEENNNVVVLCADVAESTRVDEFSKRFPDRFFETGVAEQNMATIAAGMGISGKIPFISSYATFSPGRNWEQIRTTIAYNDSNVKIVGHHAGISTGLDGVTHQATEDIAIMRAMPNMRVIVPCDYVEAKKATLAASKIWGPIYIRVSREKTVIMTNEDTTFVPGRGYIMWETRKKGGKLKPQVAIIGCGPLLNNAIRTACDLEEKGIGSVVVNIHTIKPLDDELILEMARRCGAVVTVEDHQISGGLGGAIAELLSSRFPIPVEFVGVRDKFAESGAPEALLEKYGLGVSHIMGAVKKVIRRKKHV